MESHEDAIEKGGVTVASFSDFDDDDSSGSYASVSVQSGDSEDKEEVDVLKQALKERDSRGKVKKKKKRKKKEGSDERDIDALMDSIPRTRMKKIGCSIPCSMTSTIWTDDDHYRRSTPQTHGLALRCFSWFHCTFFFICFAVGLYGSRR